MKRGSKRFCFVLLLRFVLSPGVSVNTPKHTKHTTHIIHHHHQFDQILESYRRHSKQWSATWNRFAEGACASVVVCCDE